MSAQHTPGPLMTEADAMEIAVLIQLRVNVLRDANRPAFAAELARMEAIGSRFDAWIVSKRTPAALPTEACQECGGTGAYADSVIGRDNCDNCRGSGRVTPASETAMSAAIAKATGAQP